MCSCLGTDLSMSVFDKFHCGFVTWANFEPKSLGLAPVESQNVVCNLPSISFPLKFMLVDLLEMNLLVVVFIPSLSAMIVDRDIRSLRLGIG